MNSVSKSWGCGSKKSPIFQWNLELFSFVEVRAPGRGGKKENSIKYGEGSRYCIQGITTLKEFPSAFIVELFLNSTFTNSAL